MSRFVGALAIKAREVTSSLTLMIGMNINVGGAMKEIKIVDSHAEARNVYKEMENSLETVRKYLGMDIGLEDGPAGTTGTDDAGVDAENHD